MKALCISNINPNNNLKYTWITPGKYYDVQSYKSKLREIPILYYIVLDDSGDERLYNSSIFETIEEMRSRKLKKLGI